MFKRWNMILIILTIFPRHLWHLPRSGVLSSVHAFAQSAIGPLFFTFIGHLHCVVGFASAPLEFPAFGRTDELGFFWSLFLINNLLFIGILLVCFWGVIYPLVRELFTGEKVTVSAPYYESAAGPLFAALLLLMGIAPLVGMECIHIRSGEPCGSLLWFRWLHR